MRKHRSVAGEPYRCVIVTISHRSSRRPVGRQSSHHRYCRWRDCATRHASVFAAWSCGACANQEVAYDAV